MVRCIYPRVSNYPNIEVWGPTYYRYNGFWTRIPLYLGTWALRVLHIWALGPLGLGHAKFPEPKSAYVSRLEPEPKLSVLKEPGLQKA